MTQDLREHMKNNLVAHRTLVILLMVYAISYMDRQLVAILIQPIKQELAISDTAAGLLYGFAFAAFYSVLGIPIARLADRANRSRIIVVSLLLFSAMTTTFAWAATYWQLILARIGVGIGEAGTTPPSHSIIADLFPAERRGTAMAMFAVGLHIGILLGFIVGGYVGQSLGWRATFLIAGAAGIVMAAASALLLKEPLRTGPCRKLDTTQVSIAQAVKTLSRSASMCHLFAGGTIANVATTALLAWLPAFLMRSHHLSLSTTGALLAFVFGILGGFGTMLGGSLSDRLGARDPAWKLRCIVVALLVATPFWMLAIFAHNSVAALVALMLAGTLVAFHVGPSFAVVQSLARPDMRALAASLLIFCTNLVGVGVGPLAIGALSDAWLDQYGEGSLRAALLTVPPLFLWAAVHYEIAARRLAVDLRRTGEPSVSEPSGALLEDPRTASI
jgi:predicted MFS family arabinose efflux permease